MGLESNDVKWSSRKFLISPVETREYKKQDKKQAHKHYGTQHSRRLDVDHDVARFARTAR